MCEKTVFKKKYLFLLRSLPPCKFANGVCVKKIVETFPDLDDVFAITIDDGSPHNDLNIKEFRIPQIPWFRLAEECKRKGAGLLTLFFRILLFFKRIIMLPLWPVFSFSTCYNYYKKSSELIKKDGITHVVAVCYPGETLVSMVLLKIRYRCKIKTIMYPLDVTLGGKFEGFSLEIGLSKFFSKHFYWLMSFFADEILVLENAVKLYEKKLHRRRKKFKIVGLPLIERNSSVVKMIEGKDLCLLYGGNIIKSIRNPDFIFNVLNSCAKKNNLNIKLHIYGFVEDKLLESFVSNYQFLNIVYHGWVSEEVLSQAIDNADVLISVGNNVEHLIPSKIFKYMSSKKPIIHLSFVETDPCLPYLKKYGLSYIVHNNVRINDNGMTDWLLSSKGLVDLNLEEIFYRCTPGYTAKIIQA